MAPKQKIRIKLRSYWVSLIEDSCKQILDAARNTNAKTMGPVPLPTKKRIYCVLKSPHVHKDARFHFEIRTHQRMIDILYPTAQTIDSLMQLDLPAGVDVEVNLWRSTVTFFTVVTKTKLVLKAAHTNVCVVSELNTKSSSSYNLPHSILIQSVSSSQVMGTCISWTDCFRSTTLLRTCKPCILRSPVMNILWFLFLNDEQISK